MNILEFQQQLFDLFVKKFHEQYEPKGAFINCRTLDRAEYETSNQSMYSYYIVICNAIFKLFSHWKYKIDDYSTEQSSTGREEMYNSLLESDNVIMWAFENIKI